MARPSQHGLRRVLGTSALLSTAYGDVGMLLVLSPHVLIDNVHQWRA
jgi:hypothetical protein